MSEQDVLTRINALIGNGTIRRMGARINQRNAGITANALVAWDVKGLDPDLCGSRLAAFEGVTHCYRRTSVQGQWEYQLYTVHHGWSRGQVLEEIQMIADKTGIHRYLVLFSTEEYKREPHTRADDLGGCP
jgi:DNA-binding Lrp family transcriptional regulator